MQARVLRISVAIWARPAAHPRRGALVIVNTCKKGLAHLAVDSYAALWKDLLEVEA